MDYMKALLLITLIGLCISLVKLLKAFVDAKTDEIYNKMENEDLRDTLDRLDDTVFDVVLQLSQEIVDDLKEKSADGKLTNDDIMEVRDLAVDKIKTILGAEALEFLEGIVGNVHVLIDAKIEAAVKTIKNK